ncbi:putative transcription regulator, LysR family protein [Marmoricola endophyticus]|uniref:Transcription regulator, LysR family protein n=1 Tax=Marmoricola endophyticus TaxID=2040280 RepID=A0A917BE66_9ACTN|nr:LysR family transcriptional regulator [Marmoricola endophyticus]GGF37234.1 putative transcription regulator, LysR family protein [Marmoricola endophyticus]
MEIHQLRYALAVAHDGTFTAAARRLHVAQSGVSAQVARLERELGTTLFERGSRAVVPSAAGRVLLPRMRAVLEALDRVEDAAAELSGLLTGTVHLGAVAGLGWAPFLDALEEVRERYAGLDIFLREGLAADLQAAVADGRLDVAVVSWAREPLASLQSWVAVTERVAAVVPQDHEWATRRSIRPRDLLDVKVICTSHGTGMRAAYETMMAAERLAAPVALDVTLPSTARALVARGLGVGVLTTSHADLPDDLTRVEIRSHHATSYLGVVWRGSPSAAATVMLETLRRRLAA